MKYPSFNKIERLENIYCIISEKIDGTNGLIEINYDSVKFGSKNRYLESHEDNAGFMNFYSYHKNIFINTAKELNEKEIEISGETLTKYEEIYPIHIYGEWFGKGIQRGYGLDKKFFMPFNPEYAELLIEHEVPHIVRPYILYEGKFSEKVATSSMHFLKEEGSYVIPKYMKPEGIVIYFPKYNFYLKDTFEGPKWKT